MSQKIEPRSTSSPDSSPHRPPWIQRFLDNPWILLVLGILVPFLSYTIWGWIELAAMPPATLP